MLKTNMCRLSIKLSITTQNTNHVAHHLLCSLGHYGLYKTYYSHPFFRVCDLSARRTMKRKRLLERTWTDFLSSVIIFKLEEIKMTSFFTQVSDWDCVWSACIILERCSASRGWRFSYLCYSCLLPAGILDSSRTWHSYQAKHSVGLLLVLTKSS